MIVDQSLDGQTGRYVELICDVSDRIYRTKSAVFSGMADHSLIFLKQNQD